jgi:DNA-binding Lrp family transcriptional regulator
MNELDRKILAELQLDGRLSVTDLAARIGLSLSPCHRRVRAMEQSGVIRGYRADLDPSSIGLDFGALVFVTLREGDRHAVESFEKAVVEIPQGDRSQTAVRGPGLPPPRHHPRPTSLPTALRPIPFRAAERPAPYLHASHENHRG